MTGLEPATNRVEADCSDSIELHGLSIPDRIRTYTKPAFVALCSNSIELQGFIYSVRDKIRTCYLLFRREMLFLVSYTNILYKQPIEELNLYIMVQSHLRYLYANRL